MLQSFADYVYEDAFTPTSIPTTFSIDQHYVIHCSGAATAVMSIVGFIFIFVSYICLPRLRSFPFEIILMSSFSIVFGALSHLLTNMLGTMCELSAWLLTFSGLATVFWVCSIAFTINRVLHCEDGFLQDKTKHKTCHICCWGIPAFISMLPFSTRSYDTEGGDLCWITLDTTSGKIWAILSWYIPVWVMLLYIIRVYWKSWKVLQSLGLDGEIDTPPNIQLITQTSIMVYPPIFFITASCSCFEWVFTLLGDRQWFALVLLKIMSMNLAGFFTALVFGLTQAVRMEWIACCCPRLEHKNSASCQYQQFADDEVVREIVSGYSQTSETYVKASSQSEEHAADIYQDIYNSESYRSFAVTK